MLTWGFEAEAARLAARARQRAKSRREGVSCDSSTSSSSFGGDSDSLSTSDEEYQKIIAGDEDSSEDEEEKMKKLMEKFQEFDKDGSNNLTMSEFIALGMQPSSPEGRPGNIHHNFLGRNVKSGDSDVDSLADRMDQLEKKVNTTNKKLDQILDLLKNKNA